MKTNLSRLSFKASNASFITYSGFFSLCCKSTYVMQYMVSNGEITEITRVRFSSRLHNFHQIVIKLCVCWLISRGLFALNTGESGLGSVWLLTWREQYFNRVCQTFCELEIHWFWANITPKHLNLPHSCLKRPFVVTCLLLHYFCWMGLIFRTTGISKRFYSILLTNSLAKPFFFKFSSI